MSSRSLNRAILIGNLTRDPELKYTPNGTAVCTFGVATNRNWTTQTGEIKEDVQFHRIVAWQKLAELSAKLLTKGRKVYLEGRITYRAYTAKDGQQKSITEIILDDFVVFDNKRPGETTVSTESTKQHESVGEIPVVDAPVDEVSIGEKSKKEKKELPTSKNEDIKPEDIDIPF